MVLPPSLQHTNFDGTRIILLCSRSGLQVSVVYSTTAAVRSLCKDGDAEHRERARQHVEPISYHPEILIS
jgi:hypothetical protein